MWFVCIILCTIVIECLMGRAFFPKKIKIFGWGSTTSQDVFDLYSPSHVIHGLLFYWLCPSFIIAVLVECLWEVFENTSFVINRYRQTASEGYEGDTILNSVSDVLCMSLGFWVAMSIPVYATIFAGIVMELLPLWAVRDNLTLNIIMLIHPFEKIKDWQKR